jgi:hypothetical protein
MKNSPTRLTRQTHPRETGIALVTVLIMLVLVATLVSVTSLMALGNRRTSTDTLVSSQAFYAAEAGIEAALDKIYWQPLTKWTEKDKLSGQDEFDTCAFKKWLNGVYPATVNSNVNKNNNQSCPPIGANTGSGLTGTFTDFWNDRTLSKSIVSGNLSIASDQKATYATTGTRWDDADTGEMNLRLVSVGNVTDLAGKVLATKQIERTLKIATASFGGDRFGLLTNSTNCSFCHLRIDTIRRAYSTDSNASFERVRVGVLSTDTLDLKFGGHHRDTIIAGTLYSRSNNAPSNSGTNSQVFGINFAAAGGTSIKGNLDKNSLVQMGVANGDLAKDATIFDSFTNPTAQSKKMYYKYPDDTTVKNAPYNGSYPDGPLPTVFPPVITDGDNNSLISDSEWSSYLTAAPVGTLVAKSGAALYGVRRPSSSTGQAPTLPISYDPVRANLGGAFAATSLSLPTTITNQLTNAVMATRQLGLNAIFANPNTYKGWILYQAISSPNNRDFLPTQLTTGTAAGAAVNNFYVNYNASTGTLSLRVCRYTDALGATILQQNCGLAANQMTISITITANDLFPATSNTATTDLASNGKFDGNLIINAGSINENKYVEINGTVNVNGDVVVRGLIKGQGRIVARGNIYIVGDFVYGCDKTSTVVEACRIDAGASSTSYKNPDYLPRVALLAGGNILVGDYDAPDFRTNYFQSDLINDQTYQARIPAGFQNNNFAAANTARVPWNYYNIPGATGRQYNQKNWNSPLGTTTTSNQNTGDITGFIPRLIGTPNKTANSAAAGSGRYFSSNPFGLMVKQGDAANYDGGSTGNFVSAAGSHTILPLYPSNGPILIGNNANNGLFAAAGGNELATGISCVNATNTGPIRSIYTDKFVNSVPTAVSYNRDRGFTTDVAPAQVTLNYSFWCPPSTGRYVRSSGFTGSFSTTATVAGLPGSGSTSTPATDTAAWQVQSIAGTPSTKNANGGNANLDGNLGMSTGWLAGLVGWNSTNSTFNQFGDFSQTRLLKLMWMATMENSSRKTAQLLANAGTTGGPLRTDGIFYSANGIFALARYCQDGNCTTNYARPTGYTGGSASRTQGRWIHNGSVVSAELGFLMTGNMDRGNEAFGYNGFGPITDFAPVTNITNANNPSGAALTVLYDDRLSGVLQIGGGKGVAIRRSGVFTQGSK